VIRPDYEYPIKKYFRPKLGDIVVDVGAHIGIYTLTASKRVKQKGLVIAIEPDVENFSQLSLNVFLNRIKNVKLIRAAAADVDGNITFFVSKERTGSSIARIPEELADKITVPTVKLDTIVNKFALSRIDWLKIDAEGAENLVLKGAYKALEVTKRLIIEVWPDNKKEVFRILRQYGFNVRVIYPHYQNTVNVVAER
jgi:FkbM family methyltransferase